MREEGLLLPCQGDRLVAVISHPAATAPAAAAGLGLVIVVGGPQVRTGSHRQFTRLARLAAQAGHPALRFDLRGMGDSSGQPRPYTDIDDDIDAAIGGLLVQRPGLQRALLWGLCDAATAVALYLQRRRDPRVAGVCLVNPWVRSEQTLARARLDHYYRRRLLQADFWRKLLRGGVGLAALQSWREQRRLARAAPAGGHGAGVSTGTRIHTSTTASASTLTPASTLADQVLDSLDSCGLPAHLLLADADLTAQEFATALRARHGPHPPWPVQRIADADHTFSSPAADAALMAASLAALQATGAAALSATGPAAPGPGPSVR